MLPKALVIMLLMVVTTLGTSKDVSILNASLYLVTVGQLQEIVNWLTENNIILKSRINGIRVAKVKLPLVKRFLENKIKLKEFLIQIRFKVLQEGLKLAMLMD